MDVERVFAADIRKNPDDDTPRLVYADWLEERAVKRSEFARVELIRLQIELALKPVVLVKAFIGPAMYNVDCVDVRDKVLRVEALINTWDATWLTQPLLHSLCRPFGDLTWQRGFVEGVSCQWEQWLEHGDAVLEQQPVRVVTLLSTSVYEPSDFGYTKDVTEQRWRGVEFSVQSSDDVEVASVEAEVEVGSLDG